MTERAEENALLGPTVPASSAFAVAAALIGALHRPSIAAAQVVAALAALHANTPENLNLHFLSFRRGRFRRTAPMSPALSDRPLIHFTA